MLIKIPLMIFRKFVWNITLNFGPCVGTTAAVLVAVENVVLNQELAVLCFAENAQQEEMKYKIVGPGPVPILLEVIIILY